MLTLLTALLCAAPPGTPDGIDFTGPGVSLRFVALEAPREIDVGQTLAMDVTYVVTGPLADGLATFVHVESGGDCRVLADGPLPAPDAQGVITQHLETRLSQACDAGTGLTIQLGLWTPSDGKRIATLPPQPEDRIAAGHVRVVGDGADPTQVRWDVHKLRLEGTLAAPRPPWTLVAGLALTLIALALTRKTRLMQALAELRPGLYASLSPLRLAERAVMLAAIVWSAIYVWQFLSIAVDTLAYPFPLEWMESGVVETVQRIRDGQSIYGPPTVEYVPYIYTPGYAALTAAVSLVTGVDFFAARLVSFVSILAVACLVYRFIRREVDSRFWGFIGVGLLFAMFGVTGRWYHLARVDSLNLLLMLWPLYLLRWRTGMRSAVIAGLLMTAAFMTKQGVPLAFLPPLGLLVLFDPAQRKRAFVAGMVFTVAGASTYLVAQALTDGWFKYYVFDVPAGHDIVEAHYRSFWSKDLWAAAPLMGVTLIGLALFAQRYGRRALPYVGLALGFCAIAWLSRLHNGGYTNVLIPAFAALALVAPLGFAALQRQMAETSPRELGAAPARIGLGLVVLLQLFALKYPTAQSRPAPDARENGERLLAYVEAIEGDVLMPDYDFVERRVGKASYAQGMAARDLLRIPGLDRGKTALEAAMKEAFASRRFGAVILSEESHLRTELMADYCFKERIDFAPAPVTGWVIRPQWVWVPRGPDQPKNAVACTKRRR